MINLKRGFALLETIIVITFLSVSLLLLYGTFKGMVDNSKKNILYDDVSNIYIAYYLKELFLLNNTIMPNEDINVLDCNDFKACSLYEAFNINKIYFTLYDLKDYNKESFSSNFNNYLLSLSNKDNYKYRFIVEFNNDKTYSYASVGLDYE